MRRAALSSLALFAVAILLAGSAAAHHSFATEHDGSAPIILEGVVTRVDWINPHALIHVNGAIAGRAAQAWEVQVGAPNNLLANGLNRETLKSGTAVVIRGFLAKDRACAPACKAGGQDVRFADGRRVPLLHAPPKR